ncbi:EamA family transporter [Streptomyces sp. WAC05374]|uniref:DMT family transporter n=1 Tax=Streptomyces sp. WAC05374 TaxID=2487420 RepID=UPI000F862AE5|nr:EamA family transporter [Streptomyces sp. WAC05374]RST18226.1 EamA family transporter [Streptomyces sp. WAC05374]TDF40445.1 EamA family transporter [Streptomyces sp. WAC05374]TDF49079.1 EamA family transporter [Streptomyces sp. WAC05374]TDF49565.1 EamA family transporter [Streptomyces sp. WAC05374]
MRAGERTPLLRFAACCLLAGGNAVGVRFSNRELDPLWGAALRFGTAAVVLLAIGAVRRAAWPRGRALAGAALFGVLNFGVAFALAYYALDHIHAGAGQTLLSLVPLVTLLLAVAQGQERFHTAAVAGTLLAVAGVALVSRAPLQGSVPVTALLAALGSVVAFAQAAVLVRRLPRVDPVAMNAVGMAAAAVLLAAGSRLAGDRWTPPDRAATWWALAYLVVAGSVLTFVLYLLVIQSWGASRASYVFVVIPAVTIALSAWLDDEPLTASLLLGTPLIVAGVHLGALRRRTAGQDPGRPGSGT